MSQHTSKQFAMNNYSINETSEEAQLESSISETSSNAKENKKERYTLNVQVPSSRPTLHPQSPRITKSNQKIIPSRHNLSKSVAAAHKQKTLLEKFLDKHKDKPEHDFSQQ